MQQRLHQAQQRLCRQINYKFRQAELLTEAMTHRSAKGTSNERLEFLGDGMLNTIIGIELFRRYPQANEGALSRMRATLVRESTLAQIGAELQLGECLFLGPGELKSGGFRRPSTIADAVEALIGAIYCDSDFVTIQQLVLALFGDRLMLEDNHQQLKDSKSQLQELLQARAKATPEYTLIGVSGPENEQIFHIRCYTAWGESSAEGSTRRQAEQEAARKILQEHAPKSVSL